MSEDHEDERMRTILSRSSEQPAVPPFSALVRRPRRSSARRQTAIALVTVLAAVAALYVGRELATVRQQLVASSPTAGAPTGSPGASASSHAPLPQPIAQPITRTSPAAQVAWVGTSELNAAGNGRHTVLVGVDPNGRIVGRIDDATQPFVALTVRSADGATLVTVGDTKITVYSALDGSIQRTYPREPQDALVDSAFSPDGRWFAYIGEAAYVQVVELRTGLTQTTPLGGPVHTQNGGLSKVIFSPDSKRLYTVLNWSDPRIAAFDVTPTGLRQTAGATNRQPGVTSPSPQDLPTCGGPGVALNIVGGGQTLVVFCYVDGTVAFIDLPTLTTTATVHAEMKNPFWLAPIFTPDGQLLYLHQYPAFGDFMQVVDLRAHTIRGPLPTPTKTDQPGLFSWLFPVAYAGGTPSTVPISPDGLKLYAESGSGITVLRVPDLKPIAKLAPGVQVTEVWISGDGKTVFATDGGKEVLVMREDGSGTPTTVTIPLEVGGFFASERG